MATKNDPRDERTLDFAAKMKHLFDEEREEEGRVIEHRNEVLLPEPPLAPAPTDRAKQPIAHRKETNAAGTG